MRSAPHRRLTPALILSLAALFFALGGSAFAIGDAVLKAPKPQPRCATGAVRAIVQVTGIPSQGIENLPDSYTSAPEAFGFRFNCTGGKIEAKRVGDQPGVYDVRVGGISGGAAIAGALGAAGTASVGRAPDGAYRVYVGGSVHPTKGYFGLREDLPFALVVL